MNNRTIDLNSDTSNDERLLEGLMHAASVLAQRGKDQSCGSLMKDSLDLSVNAKHLNACLAAAKKFGRVDLVERCLIQSADLLAEDANLAEFAKHARATRFEILANRYLDMKTPFRDLIKTKGFGDAQAIIYADIDLNTVDGSAVWMASVSRILSRNWKTIVVSKNPILRDAVVGDLIQSDKVLFVTPGNTDFSAQSLTVEQCVSLIQDLDNLLPNLGAVIVRGMAAVNQVMANRQLWRRVFAYLTDLYTHIDDQIVVKEEAKPTIDLVTRQAAAFLVQTPNIGALIEDLAPFSPRLIDLPPPVPDGLLDRSRGVIETGPIRIGYAGKIAPQWGVHQLCEWVTKLRRLGHDVELTIIGDKVSGAGTAAENRAFRGTMAKMLEEVDARRLGAMARNEVMAEMQTMHFAWCWRPSEFENHTLELSSKMVESVIAGIPSVVFPSPVNRAALGEDYPFFVKDFAEFEALVTKEKAEVPLTTRQALNDRLSFSSQSENLAQAIDLKSRPKSNSLLLAAHDPKFVHPYFSDLKRRGYHVSAQKWEWGGPVEDESVMKARVGDIVLCEWGLANAVWHSKNKRPGSRLVVRVHAQEVRPRAAKFGHAIEAENVDCFVFVAPWVREKAIDLFGWPRAKTIVIPNFLLDDEYRIAPKPIGDLIRLGMVGAVPWLKRIDRAVDLVEKLQKLGHPVQLRIKGPDPRDLAFMQAPNRAEEMRDYHQLFDRIEGSHALNDCISFVPPGNDVAAFYEEVDYILSPSETESFHYALADGVLCGCHPVIWERENAAELFDPEWVVASTNAAAGRIIAHRSRSDQGRLSEAYENRELLVSRYSQSKIFEMLSRTLSLELGMDENVRNQSVTITP